MITTERNVGRLIEVRITSAATEADIDTMRTRGYALVERLEAPAVFCSDMREANGISPAMAERIAEIYRRVNAKVERTAILVGAAASFREQFEKIVRDAGSPRRRVFTSLADSARYLDEVLNAEERRRLREFVAGIARRTTATAAPAKR